MVDVLLLATHWHDTDAVRRFLAHVKERAGDVHVHTVVADNSRSWIGAVPEHATVVQPPGNLGYLNGCAFGLEAWREAHGFWPRWVGVTNTDLTFEADFFARLVQTAWPADAAVLAPRIATPAGIEQNPFLRTRPSRRWLVQTGWMLRLPIVHRLTQTRFYARWRRLRAPRRAAPDMQPIYAPHGSLMLFHRRFFEHGGTLAYGGFLFGEEIHVAEQVLRTGLRTYITPILRVTHREGATTHRTGTDRRRRWHVAANRWLLAEYF